MTGKLAKLSVCMLCAGPALMTWLSYGANAAEPSPASGQSAATGDAAQELYETQSDERIAAQVRDMLTEESRERVEDLGVSVQGGIVTLQGRVGEASAKDLAGGRVGALDGVKGVVNAIQVVPGKQNGNSNPPP
jgi:osmotically-inducible protein OsmY